MKSIPNETIGRLFPYIRALVCLSKQGTDTVSSSRLAEVCHVNPAMIRKDFSYFGYFGKRGVGYDVQALKEEIQNILSLKPAKKVALIGVGNIGKALLLYKNFELEGFKITMAFDNQPNKIGRKIGDVTIEDMGNLEKRVKSENIQLSILAVPETVSPTIARRLADAGVNAILSFAPCQLAMPDNIKVTCVDLSTEMARLIYYSSREDLVKKR
ncbi:redox-sensing transcriptional repressor Rex [bacterium]|nr:redox-sensing transcriptional repressor Rex [bacterium]